jgi:hypothetical protein
MDRSTAFLPCLLLLACSSGAQLRTADSALSLAPSNPRAVRIFSDGEPVPAHEVLGVVVAGVDSGENTGPALDILRKRAAKLGADAVTHTRVEFEYGFWSIAMKATGVAVKLK